MSTRYCFSIVFKSFYRHEPNPVPEGQYPTEYFCFLIQFFFFTPSQCSPLAWSIPAPKFTNLAMPTFAFVLTRKLKDMPFDATTVWACACGGIWRQLLRSAAHITYSFGMTQPMPSVNSRTIYLCARKYARKGHSRSPSGSPYYIFWFYESSPQRKFVHTAKHTSRIRQTTKCASTTGPKKYFYRNGFQKYSQIF